MNDTPSEIEARLTALFAQRSGSDRVRMVCEMFDLARALIVGRIRAEEPEIAANDLRAKIFERTYADDFNSHDRARIAARLRG